MPDQSIRTVVHQKHPIERFQREVDQMAIVQVVACSLDEDERKERQALEFQMADELEENAAGLAGPSPSPLLQSLGLTVALCEHDIRMRHVLNGPLKDNHDGQRNLNRAMRRYLAAIKALAVVRRLDLPPIQVNVATNQVVANG
jgi:hypothetical protein